MKKIYYYLLGLLAVIISFIYDNQISLFFTSYRISFLNAIALFINDISGYMLFGVVFLLLLIRKQYKKFIPLVLAFLLYLGLTQLIKVVISRPRPFVSLDNALVQDTNSYSSFPSGHATAVSSLIPFFDFNKTI